MPYQTGYWYTDYPYGPTWVSSEPWGYAPYHYGRWANVGNQWYWVPERVNTTPAYAPALVAFMPFDSNQIGWVPLGPGDPYVARYYDENWQPHYFTRGDLSPTQLVNLGIPGAVTVVPVDALGRVIDPRMVRRFDPQTVASVRPTLEPLLLTPLRHAAINSAWGRGKIDLPPGIAKKLDDTRVFVNADPNDRRFRKDFAKAMRVDRVPDNAKNQKFKDERQEIKQADQDLKHADQARQQELHRLNAEAAKAAKGNREAERQARQLEQQQQQAAREQERNLRKTQQQPKGERVGNPASPPAPKAEKPKVEHQRVQQPGQQAQAPQRHEMKQQSQAAPKQERKQEAPAQPSGQGQGGGKGKGKKP